MEEKCSVCKFWVYFDTDKDDLKVGTCHRYPPVYVVENKALRGCYDSEPLAFDTREWQQPIVHNDEWCGEYKNACTEKEMVL